MNRASEIKKVLTIALLLNIGVSSLKLIYGFMTSTLSMIADGFHSLADAASSVLGLVAIHFSDKPSDDDHHYGHFKYETMAALGIAIFIGITSWEILKHAIHKLISHETALFHYSGIPIMIIGMIINLVLSRYEAKKGKKFKSLVLEADAYHTASDFWVSLSVIISILCIKFGILWADPIVSILIAIYFARVAIKVSKETFMALSDAAYIDISRVQRIIEKVPGVISGHHIRTRGKPGQAFIDLHIQVSPDTDTYTSHKIAHEIEEHIKDEITGVHDVLIHTEPYPDPDDVA
ncbi:MAG: cation transporter [Bdellovibrionales bacterium]|nr:cation transporter [Bdellovibrionales bacterium]